LYLSTLSQGAKANQKDALALVNKLGKSLKKELTSALKGPPNQAVETCQIKAPKIAKELSEGGIKVGRVSTRNRNPQNVPQPWMLESIGKFQRGEIERPFVVIGAGPGKKGLLRPIQTVPMCLTCHGQNIAPTIKAKISQLYPRDRAVGYTVGDIRGFFWATWPE